MTVMHVLLLTLGSESEYGYERGVGWVSGGGGGLGADDGCGMRYEG